jgi:spermidine synthase
MAAMEPRNREKPHIRGGGPMLLAIFFVSGASGLVYQVVWSRSLTLVFGSTTQGVATVLATFMGGLALGSWLASRAGDRARSPLRIYGALEGGIAILALAALLLMPALESIYLLLYEWVHLSLSGLTLLRLVLAALFLMPATTLMGATLPILSAYFERRGAVEGQGASILYAINTVGAVAGAAGAGFLLVPGLGVTGATLAAAAGNLLAALGALHLSRRAEEEEREIRIPFASRAPEGQGPAAPAGERLGAPTRAAVAAAIALSGAGALILEVCWTRTLSLTLGSSTQAFTIMLTTFLVGLAVGSALASRLLGRIGDPVAAFAMAEIGVGLAVYAGVFLFPELPYTFLQLYSATTGSPHLFDLGRFLLAASIMALPTLFLGAIFPLAVRCVRVGAVEAARPVGFLYAVNTLGAIVGSLAAGFVLIPMIGLQRSLVAGALVNLSIGAFLFAMSARSRQVVRWSLAGAIFLLMPGLPLSAPAWNPVLMTSGVFQYAPRFAELFSSRAEFEKYHDLRNQLFYRDGLTTTVTVEKRPMRTDGKEWIVLTVNGKVDASSVGDMDTQVLIGTLPLLLAGTPEKVFVIGWGSGITVGSALAHPEVKSLEAVEIEQAVLDASRYFHSFNGEPESDPRVSIDINDARHAVLVSDEKYDVIISEPSNPWISGPARLFTREFFRMVSARLKPDGILCQWVQMYGLDVDAYMTLLRTVSEEFEDVIVFKGSPGDTMILASPTHMTLNLAEMQRRMQVPTVKAGLARIGIHDLPSLLAFYRAGGEALRDLVGEGQINTDDNAYIEFASARSLYRVEDYAIDAILTAVPSNPMDRSDLSGLPPVVALRFPLFMARAFLQGGQQARAQTVLNSVGKGGKVPPEVAAEIGAIQGEILLKAGNQEGARAAWESALQADPDAIGALVSLGRALRDDEALPDTERSIRLLTRAVEVHPDSAEALLEFARSLAAAGRHAESIPPLRAAEALEPPASVAPFVELQWGRSCFATGDAECAVNRLTRYFAEWREVPKPAQMSVDAALDLGRAYLERGDKPSALEQFRVAAELGGTLATWHRGQAEAALKRGSPDLAEHHWRRAVQWNAHDTKSHIALGALLSGAGKWDEALEAWNALLTRRPDEVAGLQGVVTALSRLGRSEEAIPFLEHLIKAEVNTERLPALEASLAKLRLQAASAPE